MPRFESTTTQFARDQSLDDHNWLDFSQYSVAATVETIPDTIKQADEAEKRGDLETAESLFRRVLTIAPRHATALHGLGNVARRLGKTELAIRSIKRALATPELVHVRRCDLAAALADAQRFDEAAECYLRAIEISPEYYPAHLQFGLMLQHQERHTEAISRFRQSATLARDKADPFVALAESQRALCQTDAAVRSLQTAISREPDVDAPHILRWQSCTKKTKPTSRRRNVLRKRLISIPNRSKLDSCWPRFTRPQTKQMTQSRPISACWKSNPIITQHSFVWERSTPNSVMPAKPKTHTVPPSNSYQRHPASWSTRSAQRSPTKAAWKNRSSTTIGPCNSAARSLIPTPTQTGRSLCCNLAVMPKAGASTSGDGNAPTPDGRGTIFACRYGTARRWPVKQFSSMASKASATRSCSPPAIRT